MKILSLFDGISCARVALERAGIPIDRYYASEIDKNAVKIAQNNYPDTIQIGDVTQIDGQHIRAISEGIDLLIGGSPCQDLSIAKKDRGGLNGEKSKLFWHYVRILEEVKPKWFILENVASMSKGDRDIITKTLGVDPIMINAALVSAQNRKRYFWTNIPNISLPHDRNILLKDVLEVDVDECYQYRRTYYRKISSGKSPTLTANMGTGGNNVPYLRLKSKTVRVGGIGSPPFSKQNWDAVIIDGVPHRRFTPVDCERLQSLPDGYTEGVSKTQRYKCIGNAFNVEVVAHILKELIPTLHLQ
jgi:DNA (cytosine-5)-methyltransferase 3A